MAAASDRHGAASLAYLLASTHRVHLAPQRRVARVLRVGAAILGSLWRAEAYIADDLAQTVLVAQHL
eukprot:scaffold103385_cov66-Phaeocystis_antarctica.AAC.1